MRKHAKKISAGFDKYNKKLDEMFATVEGIEGKRFKERVADSADRYAENARTAMGLTGDKIRGYGAAVIAPFWLTNDSRALELSEHAEKISGPPVDVAQTGLKGAFRAGLVSLLTKTGYTIIRSDFDADTVAEQNEIINKFISGLQKNVYAVFTPGGDSHCDWVPGDEGKFFLEIRVSEA